MGYLDSENVTIEAILTTAGKEKIANGNSLGITKFALADDEVDYRLYKDSHPNGTDFAGEVLLNMPVFEAFVEETQLMRYKLVSLPRDTAKVPVITISNEELKFSGANIQANINPSTKNGSNNTLGYTAIVHDASVADISVAQGGSIDTSTGTIPTFLSGADDKRTQSAIGRRFVVTSKPVAEKSNTNITIVGNETGGTVIANVVVEADESVTGSS